MNVAVLTIATVLTGSVILIELRWATRPPKAQKNHNSLMKTGKASRERNPFLLTGKRRWRTISLDLAAHRARCPDQ